MMPSEVFQASLEQVVETIVRKISASAAMDRRLRSVEEAAEYIGLCKRVVWDMIANHQLPIVKHGKRTLIDTRDLDEWVERNKRNKGLSV